MYKINDILLSVYGIIPGRMPGENIAVKGIWDLPKRIGDVGYEWAERNGVEPYVDADEIFFAGRAITFQGIMQGNLDVLKSNLESFKTLLKAFKTVVPFETPYGTFCVYVKKLTPQFYNGGAIIMLELQEPSVGASCPIAGSEIVYYSEEYSETAEKNNCESGYHGSSVQLTSIAGKFTSTVSLEAANLLAIQWVRENKQDYANVHGTCIINPVVYYNVKLTATKPKNDCAIPTVGTMVTYEVPAYKYSSLISQIAADALAQNEVDTQFTQAYANNNGSCVVAFWNEAYTFYRTKNDCASGLIGSKVYYTQPAYTFSSDISQIDANLDSANFAHFEFTQADANAQGTCTSPIVSSVTHLGLINSTPYWIRRWEINPILKVGSKFIFVAYGVSLTYTVKSGDTALMVANALILAIYSTSHGDWNANNMYPLYAPTPYAMLESSSPVILSVKLYQQANFSLYVQN